jgi:hypothetical protein
MSERTVRRSAPIAIVCANIGAQKLASDPRQTFGRNLCVFKTKKRGAVNSRMNDTRRG